MAENRSGGRIKDDLLTLQYLANKALQKTRTALVSFDILLSHKVWVVILGSLPVIMARFGLLSAGVSAAKHTTVLSPNTNRYGANTECPFKDRIIKKVFEGAGQVMRKLHARCVSASESGGEYLSSVRKGTGW
jgi:hypothetical protein